MTASPLRCVGPPLLLRERYLWQRPMRRLVSFVSCHVDRTRRYSTLEEASEALVCWNLGDPLILFCRLDALIDLILPGPRCSAHRAVTAVAAVQTIEARVRPDQHLAAVCVRRGKH